MQQIPVNLAGYKLMVTEEPAMKTRTVDGRDEIVTDREGLTQFVFGLFDEPQDAHMVAPITSHCFDFVADEDGGFAVEAAWAISPERWGSSSMPTIQTDAIERAVSSMRARTSRTP